ncbi:4'-phosphopantetheinyl transferase family protein [Maribacter chungangensis]|uniref:4'-phosphopantetheinyl transferase family protein n=1 Tax=Maribacter chungangensis TaxID=1069117 RepID=UPI0036D2B17C
MCWITIILKVYSRLLCATIDTPTEEVTGTFTNTSKIRLFQVKLADYIDFFNYLQNHLNEAELKRSQKYHFKKDEHRFVICRALLKISLAAHVGLSVDEITIAAGQNKKPYLPSHPKVFFNVSHTNKYALIAISDALVGVDVEKIDREYDYSEVVPTVFNDTDSHKIAFAVDKPYTFFKLWTRKEAVVKATGKGIGENFKEIPASDGKHILPSALLSNVQNLSVLSFNMGNDHLASVALEGTKDSYETIHFSKLPQVDSAI